ncbi:protein S100-A10-like [Phyllostomus discolor]|uniref:Protein S100-A10 n=1 Tax=Phyllostomus discolor TaxID=89673 RepID=A0A7E6DSM8_9CHIR|nr:protein S100-A10-like [Phyllostomus discolor]
MPSHVGHTMETMMFKFYKLAEDTDRLTKEGLRVFMEKEFPEISENLAVDKIMKDLNQCQDGRLDSRTFFPLIAGLPIICNNYFVVHTREAEEKEVGNSEKLIPP